ncbi:MAG: hypothetical protein EOO12_05870 [Chitinophagaceae bacterium]|nr:MAG: hypothetical protein EOO12_05870 [Chitinophagaceae bacterium]
MYWLLSFIVLLAVVLVFAAVKARRLPRMPLYFPAFACLCGGVLLALLEKLKRGAPLDASLRGWTSTLATGARTDGVILAAQLLAAALLLYILLRWLRGAARS